MVMGNKIRDLMLCVAAFESNLLPTIVLVSSWPHARTRTAAKHAQHDQLATPLKHSHPTRS